MKSLRIALPLLVAVFACQAPGQTNEVPETAQPSGIEGAWRITSIQAVSPTGETSALPSQESLILFFNGYYSVAYSRHESPSPYFAERFNATDEERIDRLTALTVNTGTYELTPGKLTMHPLFALTPEFEGGTAESNYEISGNELTLTYTNVVSADGVQSPIFAAGERTVYHLERVR